MIAGFGIVSPMATVAIGEFTRLPAPAEGDGFALRDGFAMTFGVIMGVDHENASKLWGDW